MKISLIHATRGRGEKALATHEDFMKKAFNKERVEYIFAVDDDDHESFNTLQAFNPVVVKEPNGCIKAWNAGGEKATGDVLFIVSDDVVPPQDWDKLMEEALDGVNPQTTQKCLWISDGHRVDDLMVWVCMTRARYEAQGYLFYPEYFGVYADNEHTLRSRKDGVVIDARHIVMLHEHPSFGVGEWDEIYKRQNDQKQYDKGYEIFMRRNKHLL